MIRIVSVVMFLSVAFTGTLVAQTGESRFMAGAHLATAASSEFDETDVGVGARVSWHPATLLGVEGELTIYPGDLGGAVAFSASRIEGLFGVTVGPRLERVRPFAKLRPGFLTFREAPQPIACIAIFPPPLHCQIAGGQTLLALDVGGGVEWEASDRIVVRVDAGDRAVRYPFPVIDHEGTVRNSHFFGHDFRLTVGAAFRF